MIAITNSKKRSLFKQLTGYYDEHRYHKRGDCLLE